MNIHAVRKVLDAISHETIAELRSQLELAKSYGELADQEIAELRARLAAAHVKLNALEKERADWRTTAYNRYNELEALRAENERLRGALRAVHNLQIGHEWQRCQQIARAVLEGKQ
jgi:uncharacterized coiled-coil DUF342 family protein